MKWILIAAICVFLTSCATPSTMMVNPDNGQMANCATMGWGLLGSITAQSSHDACVESMEGVGWVTAEEYRAAQK